MLIIYNFTHIVFANIGTHILLNPVKGLLFPQGVYYNLENEAFRTEKTNAAFSLFASLNSITGGKKRIG